MYPWCKWLVLSLICQDLYLGEYAGVDDSWMDVISSQGSSLLSVDLSASDVTDFGLTYLKDCQSLISLNLNYCDQISDHGLECISGILSFTAFLSLKWNNIHLFLICALVFWSLGLFVVYLFIKNFKNNFVFVLLKLII